jgi:hypothetical protein
VHLKDPVEYLHAEGTIYHIQCHGNIDQDCTVTYIGETGRSTTERMKDHRANTKHPTGQYTSKVKRFLGIIAGKGGRYHADPLFAKYGILKVGDLYRRPI